MIELKSHGLEDIDGLNGFPEAIEIVFPLARTQTCIVHWLRYAMQFVSWKDRKAMAAALKLVYKALTGEITREELDAFVAGPWGAKTK